MAQFTCTFIMFAKNLLSVIKPVVPAMYVTLKQSYVCNVFIQQHPHLWVGPVYGGGLGR
jgi:hypothetical protein